VYEKFRSLLKEGGMLVFTGDADYREAENENEKDSVQLLLRTCNIAQKQEAVPDLYLRINGQNGINADIAIDTVKKHPGESEVILYYEQEKKLLKLKEVKCNVTDALFDKLVSLLGNGNVAKKIKR
jgi:DNA polymerase-3 subunit alpha